MRDDEIAHAVFDVLRTWLDAGHLAVDGRSPQDLTTALQGIVRADLRPRDADPVEGGQTWPVRADLCLTVVPAVTGCLAEALGCAAALLGAVWGAVPTTHALRA